MRKFLTLTVAALTAMGSVVTNVHAAPFSGARATVSEGAAQAGTLDQVQSRRHYRDRRQFRPGRSHYRSGRYYRGGRHYRGGRYYYDRRYYRRDRNRAAAAGIAGLAAGAIIGGAIAQGSATNRTVAYCQQRFRSYDVRTRTYLGYDGRRHACP